MAPTAPHACFSASGWGQAPWWPQSYQHLQGGQQPQAPSGGKWHCPSCGCKKNNGAWQQCK
eukprot:2675411-Pyramimonas_sp.AAC.1